MGRWDGHVRQINRCAVPGCTWEGYKRKVCPMHYMRLRRHGSYDVVLPKGRARGDDIARFWSKVERSNGCWLWLGAIQKRWGYGLFVVGGSKHRRSWLAHRFSWTLHFGEIPDGLLVCHHCDVPACVRPDHLFLGTNAHNNADMVRKGRERHLSGEEHWAHKRPELVRRGEANAFARLTNDAVRSIRERYAAGGISQQALGDEYGIHQTVVSRIVRRTAWRHVP